MGRQVQPAEKTLVSRDLVEKAVASLLKWSDNEKSKGKAQLLEDDDLFHVVVSLKKVPDGSRTNGIRIPLPHSLYPLNEGKEVCLFVKDSQEKGHKEAKEKVCQEANCGVTKVIGVRKLQANYKAFEAKRKLCDSYDIFLADDRIIATLPKLIGKSFFKKRKHPIPVDLRSKDWTKRIREACDSTYLYVSGGPCCVVRAGRTSQTSEEVVENIMAVIEGIAKSIPRKWKNVQSLFLKLTDSVSLPIYTAAPDLGAKLP